MPVQAETRPDRTQAWSRLLQCSLSTSLHGFNGLYACTVVAVGLCSACGVSGACLQRQATFGRRCYVTDEMTAAEPGWLLYPGRRC